MGEQEICHVGSAGSRRCQGDGGGERHSDHPALGRRGPRTAPAAGSGRAGSGGAPRPPAGARGHARVKQRESLGSASTSGQGAQPIRDRGEGVASPTRLGRPRTPSPSLRDNPRDTPPPRGSSAQVRAHVDTCTPASGPLTPVPHAKARMCRLRTHATCGRPARTVAVGRMQP